MNIPSDSESWRSIQDAPKDGRLVLVKGKSGEWVASWRGPRRGEPQYVVHTQKEWRDLSGRWATPDYWKPIKSELAPCPFCMGKGLISGVPNSRWIECQECWCTTDSYPAEADAVAAWNMRGNCGNP